MNIKTGAFLALLTCTPALMFYACSHKAADSSEESTEESTNKLSNAEGPFAECNNAGKKRCIVNDVAYDKIHVNSGSTTYRLCLDPDNSDNCTKPSLQNEEGTYYLTKLGMVNALFTETEAKSDENCATSAVGSSTCKKQGDYYNLAKTACEKAGSSLPTINELITLKKYKSELFPWGMFTWASDVLTEEKDSYGIGSWYQMYSDGTDTNPKIHIHNNDTSDKGVGNIQVLCLGK